MKSTDESRTIDESLPATSADVPITDAAPAAAPPSRADKTFDAVTGWVARRLERSGDALGRGAHALTRAGERLGRIATSLAPSPTK